MVQEGKLNKIPNRHLNPQALNPSHSDPKIVNPKHSYTLYTLNPNPQALSRRL